jgi:hypothetical protein
MKEMCAPPLAGSSVAGATVFFVDATADVLARLGQFAAR